MLRLGLYLLEEQEVNSEHQAKIIVGRWAALLQTGHLNPSLHVIDAETVLIYITDDTDLDEVVEFLLRQPEVEYHEANGLKRYPDRPKKAERSRKKVSSRDEL